MQPFYGRVFQGFHSRFRDQGYETIFCQMRRDGTVTPPFDWPVDGIIAVDTFSATQELVLPLNLPMVFVGPHVDVRADHVKVDLTTGSVEAVMHLLETGRKRIAFLSTQRDLDNPGGRHAAYRKVVQSAGHTPELILLDDSRREAVCSTMVSYVQKHGHPDALFCQNDTIAVTAIRGLADCGLSVPKDVSIVGFNNSEDLAYMVPSLSTVDQPVEEMCRLAMEMLQTRIKDPNREIQSTILPTNLIVRESSTRG
jgi:DNA-binding LacI/PurR family transcriptional regulator